VETARAERLRLACEKKFPKLAAWKKQANARTILVLEDNDIQLTNAALDTEAFLPLAAARHDAPDETYMIMTCTDTWYVSPVLVGDQSYFDISARRHPIHKAYPVDSGRATCCVVNDRIRPVIGTNINGPRAFAFPIPEGVF
jgi:hypothetical protein